MCGDVMITLHDVLLYEAQHYGEPLPGSDYPYSWICHDCGEKYGARTPTMCTAHDGKCDMCEQQKTVTSPRKYGYPRRDV